MKRDITGNRKGFTLIEIIVTLLLLGMMGVFGTMIMANMAKSFNMAKDNAHLTQKAQVALTRIALEVAHAHAEGFTIDADKNTITYDMTYETTPYANNIIELAGTNLILRRGDVSNTLTDRVSGFTVADGAGFFTVELTMAGDNNVTKVFSKDIAIPEY